MKRILKKILKKAGYKIVPLTHFNAHLDVNARNDGTMKMALNRLSSLGIKPRTIIDVGAAAGSWTSLSQSIWPDANYDLIEPLGEQHGALQELKKKHPSKIRIHKGVAGESEGEIDFSVTEDLDGSGVYGEGKGTTRKVNVLTIDNVRNDRIGPFLIKLDTHGYELPIIEGAAKVLKETDVLIIEVYGFFVSPTALLFHQLSGILEQRGFRLFDIVDVVRREKDNAFWQADAVYLRNDHTIFTDNSYNR